MDKLARKVIKLAYEKPELRKHLLPLLEKESRQLRASDDFEKSVGDKKVKSPDTGNEVKIKSLSGGGEKSKALYQKLKKEWSEKNKTEDKGGTSSDKKVKEIVERLSNPFKDGGDVSELVKAVGGSKASDSLKSLASGDLGKSKGLKNLFDDDQDKKTEKARDAVSQAQTVSKRLMSKGKSGELDKKTVNELSKSVGKAVSELDKLDMSTEALKPLKSALDNMKKLF